MHDGQHDPSALDTYRERQTDEVREVFLLQAMQNGTYPQDDVDPKTEARYVLRLLVVAAIVLLPLVILGTLSYLKVITPY